MSETLEELHDAVVAAIVADACREFRMAGFPRPFADPNGPRYNHIFPSPEDYRQATERVLGPLAAFMVPPHQNLSLCSYLAVVHPDRLRPMELDLIDCKACLFVFTALWRESR